MHKISILAFLWGFAVKHAVAGNWPQKPIDWEETWKSETEDVVRHCSPRSYLIESGKDLDDNFEDLECIFWAGVTPHTAPLGIKVLKSPDVKHNPWLGALLDQGLHGHFMWQTVCQGKTLTFDQPSVNPGIKPSTAKITVEPMPRPLAPGEYNDGKPSLQFDYDSDFILDCPMEVAEPEPFQSFTHMVFAPFIPFNAPGAGIYYDSGRIVGRNKADGSAIILEKFYTRDDPGYTSIGFVWFQTHEPVIAEQVPMGYVVRTDTPFKYTQKSGAYIFKAMVKAIPGEIASLPFAQMQIRV